MTEDTKTILIVEDDELTRQALEEGTKASGFDVLGAADGEQGLKLAKEKHPDLILLDLMMPKKDGHEMLKELRTDEWGANVPVLVLTNAGDNLDIHLATTEGATGYAIKSDVKLEEIVSLINKHLEKK